MHPMVGTAIAVTALLVFPESGLGRGNCGSASVYGAAGFELTAGKVQDGASTTRSVSAHRYLTIAIRNPSRQRGLVYTVSAYTSSPLRPLCSDVGALLAQEEVKIDLSGAAIGNEIKLRIGANGHAAEFSITGDWNPKSDFKVTEIVTRRLYIVVFPNARLAHDLRTDVAEAVKIWSAAGIVLNPHFKEMTVEEEKLLGEDRKLDSIFSDLHPDQGDWEDRAAVQRLKGSPNSLGLIFASTTSDGYFGTRADYPRTQAYIGGDVPGAPPGRTLAHEIGHILLEDGKHTGTRGSTATSGLMYGGNNFSKEISAKDARRARTNARKLPVP